MSGGILSGGILSGGILSGGILSWGDIVRGDIVRGDIVRGDIVRGDIVLEPTQTAHTYHQGLSQDLETGCLKLAVVKFLGVQIFKGDNNILRFQQ